MIEYKYIKEECKIIAYVENTKVGECVFCEENDVWNIVHTSVEKEYRGQEIAKKLVDEVVKQARLRGRKVIAECSYAKKVLEGTKKI